MSRAIALPTGSGNVQALTGPCTLVGFSCRETGGTAAADIVLRDGTTISDPIKAVIRLPANGSQASGLPAVDFASGIFINRSGTGSSELVVYIQ